MQRYLLFESRDPMESRDCAFTHSIAKNLAKDGNEVVVFLIENGVFPVRQSSYSADLQTLSKEKGIQVWADAFALRERGITPERMTTGITVKDMNAVIDCLCNGYKVIWH